MGRAVTERTVLERSCRRLTEFLSRALDPAERDAIGGDLEEAAASGPVALREVAGLLLRRQAAAWCDWRPWFALFAIVLPIGALLSHVSRAWGISTAITARYFWLLGDVAYLANPGWRADLLRFVAGTGIACLALVGWSWTAGFVFGHLSRPTRWVMLMLLSLIVLLATLGTVTTGWPPRGVLTLEQHVVFVVCPRLLRAFLVIVPAALGAWRGGRQAPLPIAPTVAGVLLLVLATTLASQGLEATLTFGRGVLPADLGPDGFVVSDDDPRPLWFLSFVMIWPAVYILATMGWQQWRTGRALV